MSTYTRSEVTLIVLSESVKTIDWVSFIPSTTPHLHNGQENHNETSLSIIAVACITGNKSLIGGDLIPIEDSDWF